MDGLTPPLLIGKSCDPIKELLEACRMETAPTSKEVNDCGALFKTANLEPGEVININANKLSSTTSQTDGIGSLILIPSNSPATSNVSPEISRSKTPLSKFPPPLCMK